MFDFTAADLRHKPTPSEQILWEYLRARQMLGLKFRRQHPLGPFIVDFVCLSRKIIVEVDGAVHDLTRDYDRRRDRWLMSQGFWVIRITNEQLQQDVERTLVDLRRLLLKKIGF